VKWFVQSAGREPVGEIEFGYDKVWPLIFIGVVSVIDPFEQLVNFIEIVNQLYRTGLHPAYPQLHQFPLFHHFIKRQTRTGHGRTSTATDYWSEYNQFHQFPAECYGFQALE